MNEFMFHPVVLFVGGFGIGFLYGHLITRDRKVTTKLRKQAKIEMLKRRHDY